LRFQYAKDRITDEELRYFTEVTAFKDACRVVERAGVLWQSADGIYCRCQKAEVAAVEYNSQHGGIGTILLEELASPPRLRHTFLWRESSENERMVKVLSERL
jgi:hypothetical protein